MTYPIYFIRFGREIEIVFPEDKSDIGHVDFWEQTVSGLVADYYKIPRYELLNIPYSQHRGRVVDDKLYCGAAIHKLMGRIRKCLENENLDLYYDDHERCLIQDVLRFKSLIKQYT